MYCKVLCLAALVAIVAAQGGSGGHGHDHEGYSSQYVVRHDGHDHEIHVPVKDKHGKVHHVIDYRGDVKYDFGYKVKDPHTHDIKSQHETRHGDQVKGYYELVQPDGHVRKVNYNSEYKKGFQADVKLDTHHTHQHHH